MWASAYLLEAVGQAQVAQAGPSRSATERRSATVSTSSASSGSSWRTAPGTLRCLEALPGPKPGRNDSGSRQASTLVPAPSALGTTTTGASAAASSTRLLLDHPAAHGVGAAPDLPVRRDHRRALQPVDALERGDHVLEHGDGQ